MQHQRNFVLAIALSLLAFVAWTFVSSRYFPAAAPQSTKIVDGKQVALPTPESHAEQPSQLRDRALVLRENPRVAIATPRVAGSINLKGGRIDDLVLSDHRAALPSALRNSAPSAA